MKEIGGTAVIADALEIEFCILEHMVDTIYCEINE